MKDFCQLLREPQEYSFLPKNGVGRVEWVEGDVD